MDIVKGGWRRNLSQAWRRCRSHLANSGGTIKPLKFVLTRSKTWHSGGEDRNKKRNKNCQVAPDGCFSVYVGPEKERFVIKTEFANHPLFKILLEDAELEYGFNSDGPILLPCDVDLFCKVLAEMDNGDEIAAPAWSPMVLCSPRRSVNRGYRLLSPSPFVKLNQK